MGFCFSKSKPQKTQQIEKQRQSVTNDQKSTQNDILTYVDSQGLTNLMKTKPIQGFINELLITKQIDLKFCELFFQLIETKSQLILRAYNDFTEKALKIKQTIQQFYKNEYQFYCQYCQTNNLEVDQIICQETLQLLLETIIIINCLMDKNFDDEEEFWWGEDYFHQRIIHLGITSIKQQQEQDKLVSPILQIILALKQKIYYILPDQKNPFQNVNQIGNSVVVAADHLTQFYNELKLQLDEQQIT